MELIQVEKIVFEIWKIVASGGIGFAFGTGFGVSVAIRIYRSRK